jgi:hypothetical protein
MSTHGGVVRLGATKVRFFERDEEEAAKAALAAGKPTG